METSRRILVTTALGLTLGGSSRLVALERPDNPFIVDGTYFFSTNHKTLEGAPTAALYRYVLDCKKARTKKPSIEAIEKSTVQTCDLSEVSLSIGEAWSEAELTVDSLRKLSQFHPPERRAAWGEQLPDAVTRRHWDDTRAVLSLVDQGKFPEAADFARKHRYKECQLNVFKVEDRIVFHQKDVDAWISERLETGCNGKSNEGRRYALRRAKANEGFFDLYMGECGHAERLLGSGQNAFVGRAGPTCDEMTW
jgi:hypothetical protein